MNRTAICGTAFLLALAASPGHAQAVKGTGTGGTIPVWTSTSTIGNSALAQSGSNVTNASGNVAARQLVSTVGTGTAPLMVTSTTQVPNLNASSLGGFGPGGFIQNSISQQTGANFNIDGNGTLGGTVSAGTINSAGTYQIGGSAVLSVTDPIIGNLFVGIGAGAPNTTGDFSTAVGTNALSGGSTGTGNTAIGIDTLQKNTSGTLNTAIGSVALGNNTQGSQNTASGSSALGGNTTGSGNVADGALTLQRNGTGSGNTAIGNTALQNLGDIFATNNTPATDNTAVGYFAGSNLVVGKFNILLGAFAGFNFFNLGESMNIDIGNLGVAGESGVIRIGTDVNLVPSCATFPGCQAATFIAGINGVTTGSATTSTVLIDANGQLGTIASSRRYKEDIHDMGEASDGLLRLRPVTFRYKKGFDDSSKPIQYGLVAEEVAEVYPELVVRGNDGQAETVQYYKLDAMLLNEIQKLAKAHAADQAEIAQLRSQVADQLKQGQEQQATMRQLLDQIRVIQATLAATSAPKGPSAEVAAKY